MQVLFIKNIALPLEKKKLEWIKLVPIDVELGLNISGNFCLCISDVECIK